jgi:hypothetical protein
MYISVLVLFCIILVNTSLFPPIWTPSSDIQANEYNVIPTLTDSIEASTAVIAFSRAFTAAPSLSFGVSKY